MKLTIAAEESSARARFAVTPARPKPCRLKCLRNRLLPSPWGITWIAVAARVVFGRVAAFRAVGFGRHITRNL